MNYNEIINRIFYLREAIAYSRCKNAILSLGQGIVLNQEVAYWLSLMNEESETLRRFVIPNDLENKAALIHEKIEQSQWKKPIVRIEAI